MVETRYVVWEYYPKPNMPTEMAAAVIGVFDDPEVYAKIKTHPDGRTQGNSDYVLRQAAPGLTSIGFEVERGKKKNELIAVPVLLGPKGETVKAFYVDARSRAKDFVVEVEAGQGYANKNFLKDFFEACVMERVDYLAIVVLKCYTSGRHKSKDFANITRFFDVLFASNRLRIPLKGILIIGY